MWVKVHHTDCEIDSVFKVSDAKVLYRRGQVQPLPVSEGNFTTLKRRQSTRDRIVRTRSPKAPLEHF